MMEDTIQILIAVLLAGAGSVARLLNQKHGRHTHGVILASSCFVAMFAGVIAYYISKYFDLDLNISYVFAGVCGWAGPHTLDVITAAALKRAGIDFASEKEETSEKEKTSCEI
jgi:hypothetical protein